MYEVNPGYFHNFLFTNRNKNLAGLIYLENPILQFHFFVLVLLFHPIL